MTSAAFYRHRWLLIRLPLAMLAVALTVLAWRWLYPMLEARLTISTGQPDGAYHQHATRYVEAFARHGIALTLKASAGSADNLQRLQSGAPDVDLALVQGGFGWSSVAKDAVALSTVQTLANVDIEGLWLFGRDLPLGSLLDLVGLKVAAGPDGSGHRVMLLRLLHQLQVPPDAVALSDLSGLAARDALVRGDVQAVFMVAAPGAPGIGALLTTPGVQLAVLRRATAISDRNNYLESRLLPEDALGLRQPPVDTALLTTPTHLLVRHDLDPALKRVATAVAIEVHRGAGPFHREGEYPTLRHSDFPTAPEARQVFAQGLGGLEALLPFWWAQVLQRLLIIGVPVGLLTLLLAVVVPAWVRWRLESRITRWYGELKFIENDLGTQSVNLGGIDLSRMNGRLREIENAIAGVSLPPELAQRWYTLRHHVEFVRGRIKTYRGR